MNNDLAPPPGLLDRFILTLFALMGVAARFLARVLGSDDGTKRRFALLVKHFTRRGYVMRYEGEDDATVQKRIDMLLRAARDPLKSARGLVRRMRGLWRARQAAQSAPISFDPPLLACAPLADGVDVDALSPDTS